MSAQKVVGVSKSKTHSFTKYQQDSITLIKGHGVEGDAHAGKYNMHLYVRLKNPFKQNLRQVHLIHSELFDELKDKGFAVSPGEMGENITTQGIDLLSLPKGTKLVFGRNAEIEITGLREPCKQMDKFQKGLMKATLDRDENGNLIRKSGVMAIVLKDGIVNVGDSISIIYPEKPYEALAVV